jgi:tetratricopeptide (TPR) repeat protein
MFILKLNKIFRHINFQFLLTIIFLIIFNSTLSSQATDTLNQSYKDRVLLKVSRLIEEKYVIPEKAKITANKFKDIWQSGPYDLIKNYEEFARQITKDLITITKDKHIKCRVRKASSMGESSEGPLHHPVRYHLLGLKENKGFHKLEWLDGNIGYLDIRRFYYFPDIKERVTGAIAFLSQASAIIIDVRENGGGSGDYLSSYFLPYPTQLNSWYSREDDFLTEFWTHEDIGMEPLLEVPVFILTGKNTFSAAESFAFDMQVRGRAILIGDSTKGGAHSVDLYPIDDQFEIYIPTVRAINPVTDTNWEGSGVIPDILVASEDPLDSAIVLATEAGKKYREKQEAELSIAVAKMQDYLERSEFLLQKNNIQRAAIVLDSVFIIAREHSLLNHFFIDVLAYDYASRNKNEMLFAILKKKVELYPQSSEAYESLAYAYYKKNEIDQALKYYKYLLELSPNNQNARNMIEFLQNP